MKPYYWMIDYTEQRDWIEGKGLFLLLAFFFSEAGAGLYLVSLFIGFPMGCLIGLLVCGILGGGLHVAYLGKPQRAWRVILRPAESELSRGTIFMGLFLVLGAFQAANLFGYLPGPPWQDLAPVFMILMTILGFLVITHGFMTLNIIHAIPFWNSSIIPVLSLASGIWIGTQSTMVLGLFMHQTDALSSLEPVARWSLISYVLLVIFYLWNAGHASLPSQKSLQLLTGGGLAPHFYVGVVALAILIPLIISVYFYRNPIEPAYGLLFLRSGCALLGDLTLRYCILRAARYCPLISSNTITETTHRP